MRMSGQLKIKGARRLNAALLEIDDRTMLQEQPELSVRRRRERRLIGRKRNAVAQAHRIADATDGQPRAR